jgi:hypothetical protein
MDPPALRCLESIEQLYPDDDQVAGDVAAVVGPIVSSVPIVSTAARNPTAGPVGSTSDRPGTYPYWKVVFSFWRPLDWLPHVSAAGFHFHPPAN